MNFSGQNPASNFAYSKLKDTERTAISGYVDKVKLAREAVDLPVQLLVLVQCVYTHSCTCTHILEHHNVPLRGVWSAQSG